MAAKTEAEMNPEMDGFDRPLDGWEAAYEDSGYKIDLKGAPGKPDEFVGTFLGTKVYKDVENSFSGKKEDVTMLLFADSNGEKCNCWANYALTEALNSGKLVEGKQVKIIDHGKESIKDGKQQLSKMDVLVKAS